MKSALIRVPLPAHLALSLTAIALGLALTACSGDSDSDSDASDDSGPGAPLGELATSTAAPAATAVSTATSDPTARPGPRADVIFINGQIITMEADQPSAEALAVLGEDILLVGSNAEVMALAGPGTQTIDLAGRTLMPGFVDAHTHPFGRFESLQQDQQYLLAGGTTTIGDAAVSADKLANVMVALEVTELRVRVSLYLSYNSKCNGLQTEDWILDHPPILDPAEMLRIPGIKIFADPAGPTTSCGWAEMSVLLPPVFAEQRNAEPFGQDLFTAAEMAEVITKYQALGYQVAIHTRGDVTTETVLNAIEMALAGEPNSFRHRVEHNDFIRPELLARYGEIGALPVMRGRPFACFLGLTGGNHGFGEETNTWFLAQLLTIGPEADLVKPGCAEERIGAYAASKGAASLGLILIEKSPVRWLNQVEVAARKRRLAKVLSVAEALWGEPLGAKRGPIQTFECLLADPRLSAAAARVRILTRPPGLLDAAESTRQLGPWQEGSGEYLQSRARAGTLEALIEAGNALLAQGDLVEVRSHPAAGAWSISFRTEADSDFADLAAGLTLARWQAFEGLAAVLVAEAGAASD